MFYLCICLHNGGEHELTLRVTWRFFCRIVLLIFLVFCGVFPSVLCLLLNNAALYLDCPFLIAPSGFSNVRFVHNKTP